MECQRGALPGYGIFWLVFGLELLSSRANSLRVFASESCGRLWDAETFFLDLKIFFDSQETNLCLVSSIHTRPLAG